MGSIRAVTNSANEVISAYDYDAWGYKLREWKSGNDAKYRFTGKERDNETGYDYFGARYYDSRIGRWGGVEPLYEKYISWTPYCYVLNNSIKDYDEDGK
ncbi:MAG: RHS repeat-associated core domain-containing protein [Ignavibacteria bacterium]|nr:RHS repeat-associated core domain-containing protein [Ignavibacteria bacterium]